MGLYVHDGAEWRVIATPFVNVGGVWKRADRVFQRRAGVWELVWPAPPRLGLVGVPTSWESVRLTWAPTGVVVDRVEVMRGSTVLASAATSPFDDTGLMGGTSYQYTVRGYRDGVVAVTESVTVATPAREDMGLATVGPVFWDQAALGWSDPSGGSVAAYRLRRDGSVVQDGPEKVFVDSGLLPGATHVYALEALRADGTVVGSDSLTVTTPAYGDPGLTATASGWDKVALAWTDPDQRSVDSYRVKRGSTVVYEGADKAFTDTLLLPSTAYSYSLECLRAGAVIHSDPASATTAAHPDLGLTATAVDWDQINLAWAAKNGSVDSFKLKRGSTAIYTGTGTSKSDTGLAASTNYSYTLEAFRSGVVIKSDTASKATPARPTSSGTVQGPAASTSTGWTQSSARTLVGPSLSMPASGYITSFTLLAYGRSGYSGYFDPYIDGTRFGYRAVSSGRGYKSVSTGNHSAGAGAHGFGCYAGGNSAYQTEWSPWDGQRWDYYVSVGQFNYWHYTSLQADEGLEAFEWWTPDLAGVPLHIDWQADAGGRLVAASVHDRESMERILEWAA